MMKSLIQVHSNDLEVGQFYLIEYIGENPHSHPRYKGKFIGNDLPEWINAVAISKFNNVVNARLLDIDSNMVFTLPENLFRYYKATSLHYVYTRHVLQNITGDPDFDFDM